MYGQEKAIPEPRENAGEALAEEPYHFLEVFGPVLPLLRDGHPSSINDFRKCQAPLRERYTLQPLLLAKPVIGAKRRGG